jgi:hypothetical protein
VVVAYRPHEQRTRPRNDYSRQHGAATAARPSASTITLSAPVDNLTAKREAQTAADLAQAQQLAEEARQLIVGDYAKAAREIAETLERLATIESEVRALNARLPNYIGYIQTEAFRGHGATLGQTVVLPAIGPDDAAFWPTRPRLQTINELYARS